MYPGDVIGKVMDWGDTGKSMSLSVGLEHEAKVDVVPKADPAIVKSLASVSVVEIVDPVAANSPGVASCKSPRMVPNLRRYGIGQPLRLCLVIVNHIQACKHGLIRSDIEIKF